MVPEDGHDGRTARRLTQRAEVLAERPADVGRLSVPHAVGLQRRIIRQQITPQDDQIRPGLLRDVEQAGIMCLVAVQV